jgi:hypothetical protein
VGAAGSYKCLIEPMIRSDEPFLWEMLYQAIYVPPKCGCTSATDSKKFRTGKVRPGLETGR